MDQDRGDSLVELAPVIDLESDEDPFATAKPIGARHKRERMDAYFDDEDDDDPFENAAAMARQFQAEGNTPVKRQRLDDQDGTPIMNEFLADESDLDVHNDDSGEESERNGDIELAYLNSMKQNK